jgi:hypothetical protein
VITDLYTGPVSHLRDSRTVDTHGAMVQQWIDAVLFGDRDGTLEDKQKGQPLTADPDARPVVGPCHKAIEVLHD